MSGAGTWAEKLGDARRAEMVGRDLEMRRLTDFLHGDTPRLLYIHGAGGSGKTLLVREWIRRVTKGGIRVASLDGQLDAATPAAIEAAARGAAVVVLDDLHLLAPLEAWFFDVFLPSLPDDVRVVVTSRRPPRAQERLDPAWRTLMSVLQLQPLNETDCRRYLNARGVAAIDHGLILSFARGTPLWLCVAADLTLAHPERRFEVTRAAEKLRPLVERLLDETESTTHRRALQAAALLPITTESLLTRVLAVEPADGTNAFRWLCERPYVQTAAEGIRLHDTLRDSVRADVRWRDPDLARAMLDRAYEAAVEAVWRAAGAEQERKIVQLCDMLSREPGGAVLGGPGDQEYYTDAITDEELPLVYESLERHAGVQSARIAASWLRQQRGGLVGFRDSSRTLVAFVLYVDVDEQLPAELREIDPFVETALRYVCVDAPLRPGEGATMVRYWLAIESYQQAVPLQFRMFAHIGWRLVFGGTPVSGAVHADPDFWMKRPDRPHELLGTFTIEGRAYGLFGTDWRRTAREPWVARFIDAVRIGTPPPGAKRMFAVLGRERFDRAVRAALRGYIRKHRLADSPLLETQLVAGRAGPRAPLGERIEALLRVIEEAVARLEAQPGTRRHAVVLEQAFLRTERKGLAVAAHLGLPYGSYRRLVNEAVQLVVEDLWAHDLAAGTVSDH